MTRFCYGCKTHVELPDDPKAAKIAWEKFGHEAYGGEKVKHLQRDVGRRQRPREWQQ